MNMIEKTLITFDRHDSVKDKADWSEKMGNLGLGLWRIGFGDIVKIQRIGDKKTEYKDNQNYYSLAIRISALILIILISPVAVLMSTIGIIATACSKSHAVQYSAYNQARKLASIKHNLCGGKDPGNTYID
jgi:hypothetical protein